MNNLKKLLELKRMSPRELARRSNVSEGHIIRLTKEPEMTPLHGTAIKLAYGLQCTVAEILGQKAPGIKNIQLLADRTNDAAEELVRALRIYQDAPASVTVYADTGDGVGLNYYSIHIEDAEGKAIYDKAAYLKYDENGELVFCQYHDGERRAQ